MIDIADHADGCVVCVRAQPGSRRNGIVGNHAGSLKVAVTAPAQDGRANAALVEVLAKQLELKRSQVELLAGPAQRDKRFLLRGITVADIRKKLARFNLGGS